MSRVRVADGSPSGEVSEWFKELVLKTGAARLQSSNLWSSAIKYAQIAQSVEQGTENPRVGGSIPPLGTT